MKTVASRLGPEGLSPYFQRPFAIIACGRPAWKQALWLAAPGPAVLGIGSILMGHVPSRDDLTAVFGVALATLLGVLLLNLACRRTSGVFEDVRKSVRPNHASTFRRRLESSFDGRPQRFMALAFGAVGLILTVLLGAPLSGWSYIAFFLQAAIAWPLNGFGLAMAVAQLRWLTGVASFRGLKLNLIPAETRALKAASGLAGMIALLFSLQTVFEIVVFFLIDWRSSLVVETAIWAVMMPLGALALCLLAWPQVALARRVRREKKMALRRIDRQFQELDTAQGRRDTTTLSKKVALADLQARLTHSSSTPAGVGTILQYAPTIGLSGLPLVLEPSELRSLLLATFFGPS